jgi:acetyl/propionyl-CoA carboxylase alpha subunit
MGFWNLFRGDLGDGIDISDAASDIDLLNESYARGRADPRFDPVVADLIQSTYELTQVVSVLMKRLIEKEVLTTDDISHFARFIADAERSAQAKTRKSGLTEEFDAEDPEEEE